MVFGTKKWSMTDGLPPSSFAQAAAGWPTSELLDRPIAEYFNVPSVLDDMDRVPSFVNGNLDQVSPEFWGFCLGLTAAIDSYQTQRSRTQKDYTPGDLGWDPLQCASTETSKREMQLAEMQNGRLAMLGVTGYAVQEFIVPQAVVEETPFFFQPLTETVEAVLKGLLE
jgi:Chlorophyll A-B binding protein